MKPRANWKGFLKVAELVCPVALYTAASTAERIAFHTLNRETGHRVQRQFVDSDSGEPVAHDDQVKGYEVGQGDYIVLEPGEIAAATPESDKTLAVEAFIPSADIDDVYLDKPYYLAPSDQNAEEAFALIRDGLKAKDVVALAQAVLFRRVRTLLIRAEGAGLIATTLNFNYEVRAAAEVFSSVPEIEIGGEMLDLAKHIITTKSGSFDPKDYTDRYEAALADLVKAKLEGRPIAVKKAEKSAKVVDLMAALRESAGMTAKKAPAKPKRKTAAQSKTKAKAKAKAKAEPARKKAG